MHHQYKHQVRIVVDHVQMETHADVPPCTHAAMLSFFPWMDIMAYDNSPPYQLEEIMLNLIHQSSWVLIKQQCFKGFQGGSEM